MDIKTSFGNAIRYFRSLQKVSQEELAVKCSLHRTYISDIERGTRNVSLMNIEALANGLNISIVQLLIKTNEFMKE